MRARYHDALAPTYLILDEKQAEWHQIGQKRKHVFDFEDGTRLIISRERMAIEGAPPNQIIIHVSASFDPQSALFDQVKRGAFSLADMHRMVRLKFRAISADLRPLRPFAITVPKGVPHYIIEERNTPL